METYTNKPKRSQVPTPQQPKATPSPSPQQAHDIPRPKPTPTAAPTQEDIAKRAYEIYVKKGCPEGQSEQIWKQAERELTK